MLWIAGSTMPRFGSWNPPWRAIPIRVQLMVYKGFSPTEPIESMLKLLGL